MQAVKCCLANIEPAIQASASSVWSEDAARLCHKFVKQYSECSVTPVSQESGVYYVSLRTGGSCVSVILCEFLMGSE